MLHYNYLSETNISEIIHKASKRNCIFLTKLKITDAVQVQQRHLSEEIELCRVILILCTT